MGLVCRAVELLLSSDYFLQLFPIVDYLHIDLWILAGSGYLASIGL